MSFLEIYCHLSGISEVVLYRRYECTSAVVISSTWYRSSLIIEQFLDSVLTSIETGKPTPVPPPTPAVRRPSEPLSSTSTTKPEARNPNTGTRAAQSGNGNVAGTKRRAEEQLGPAPKPGSRISSTPAKPTSSSTVSKPRPSSATTAAGQKQVPRPMSKGAESVSSKSASPAVTSKPPPKGSYADLMMKAKELQQKAPTTVGKIKHQPAPKEKLSKAERKRRILEGQTKDRNPRLGTKSASPGAGIGGKAGVAGLGRKRTPEEPTYKGTGRPTQPPPQPEYRGTAGLPSRRGANDRKDLSRQSKRSRMDEYLATDEEDEGDYGAEQDDYYSESSDMEAGLDDVEEEEQSALKAARREDEEEWHAELAAKQAKQKKLAGRK